MYNIGIIGLGFLGGSLAKSFSKSKKVNKIIAFDKNIDSLKKALSDKVISNYTTDISIEFNNCDFVFISTPVSYISEYVKKLEKIVKKDCIITDTGSTKKTILENVKDINVEFIGGHPMVGHEKSGYETSKDLLFENSYYIITKNEKTSQTSLNKFKELIMELQAIPIIIDENNHDYITSIISHVPHVVASSLVHLLKNSDDENQTMKTLAAGGFKDITRIASSDPTMWENICHENKEHILNGLNSLLNILENFKNNIENRNDTFDFFKSSKEYRDSFISKKIDGNSMPELNISIKDETGAISNITTILSKNNLNIKNIEVLNNRENNFGALRIVLRTYEERDTAFDILKDLGFDIKIIG